MFGGEMGIKIKEVRTDNIVYPYRGRDDTKVSVDLTIESDTGNFLHICGDNDWGYFALEMLKPIHKEAENLINDVKTRIARIGDKPEAIMLGVYQQRVMDIHFGGKGNCTEIAGIPIARSNETKAFRYIGNIHDKGMNQLPF